MISGPSGTIYAVDFVRKMQGKSQAALIEASDRERYIVKWMHGPRSTVGVRLEALRNSVYQYLGLPVSTWTTIDIPDRLIDAHPEMWISSPRGLVRPDAGPHQQQPQQRLEGRFRTTIGEGQCLPQLALPLP